MKTLQFLFVLVATIILISSCNNDSDKPDFKLDSPNEILEENYEIYSRVIAELFTVEQIVIEQTSNTNIELQPYSSYYDILLSNNPGFSSELVTDLNANNKEAVSFGELFKATDIEFKLLSDDEQNYIFDGNDINKCWTNFYKTYSKSNGIISLSQIGFNNQKTQAVFEISHMAASLAGGGSIIYLQKEDNKWVVKDILYTWVS